MHKAITLFLLLLLAACYPSTPTQTVVSTTLPTLVNTVAPISRYGTFNIPSVNSSGVTGTFTAKDNGDGSTLLNIQVNPAVALNPWGIFNIGDCIRGIPENTRPIFTLADIENGQKEESVETEPYQTTAGNLILVIFGIAADGAQQMVACTELGLPLVDAHSPPSTPTSDCAAQTMHSPELVSGTWLAYTASVNNNSDIYLLNVDSVLQNKSPVVKRLTTDPATDFDPTWSPDGTQLAFRSQRDGNDEIYVMNADGSCQTNLTHSPSGDWSPAWSPNGKRIAFAHFLGSNQFTDIALINADGSGLTRLTRAGGEYPAWSPDGKRIAFASAREGGYDIYVINADGTGEIRLTDNPAYEMSPSWSPDGTKIVFDTQGDLFPPAETGIGPEFEIHVMDAEGAHNVRLTNNTQEDRFPDWNPNGLIAFTSNGRLLMMNENGTNAIRLLESGSFPDWRPAQP